MADTYWTFSTMYLSLFVVYVLVLPMLNYSACKFTSQFFYYYFCLVHTVQVDYDTKAQGLENSEISPMLFIYCLKIVIYLLF